MNTEMMKKSFNDCITNQTVWPKAFLVEHGNKNYCDDLDFNVIANIIFHPISDLEKVLELPIVGFTFGENPRPIVYDATLDVIE